MNMDIKDRIRGGFIGMYFGMGVNPRPAEIILSEKEERERKEAGTFPLPTPEEARRKFKDKGFDDIPRDYKLYDNHTQTRIICDILLERGGISPEMFRDKLLELHKEHDVFKGNVYGPSTKRAVNAILAGEDINQMGRKGITCGSVMRALPIGMYFYNDTDKLIGNTVNSCIVTHNTDVAIESAIAVNVTLAGLLNGMKKYDSLDEGIRTAKKIHGKFGERTTEPRIRLMSLDPSVL